jgi:prepilin-type N-terminal cleavage/methylation domain-containing protein
MRGVTLLEMLVVIVIIGVLATLAVTNFEGARERAFGKEAVVSLRLIAAAEKNFRLETNSYYASADLNGNGSYIDEINTNLKLQLEEDNWDYFISSTGSGNFTATADRQGAGGFRDCVYTIIQGQDEPSAGASCP